MTTGIFTIQGYGEYHFHGIHTVLCPSGQAMLLHIKSGGCALAAQKLAPGACLLLGSGAQAELQAPGGASATVHLFLCEQPLPPVSLLQEPTAGLADWLGTPQTDFHAGLLAGFTIAELPSLTLADTKEYIEHSYADDITLDTLAAYAGCSKYTLIRGFKKHWGCTPMGYLALVRLQRAKRMLTDTYLSVELVSELCGFSSASYMITCFKKEYGQTPHSFRQSH